MQSTFLTAEWRKLILANYIVDPGILKKYVPARTELDFWNDRCYVSLVGFMFLNTRVLGRSFPFHRNFEEINLRFYVRFKEDGTWKRGVVFIKELVPKAAITLIAKALYRENYQTCPMRHEWNGKNGLIEVRYEWKVRDAWNSLFAQAEDSPANFAENSEEAFITQHFWGYTKLSRNKTSEYEVGHPEWQVYPVINFGVKIDGDELYGQPFGEILNGEVASIFLAEGSEIFVKKGRLV